MVVKKIVNLRKILNQFTKLTFSHSPFLKAARLCLVLRSFDRLFNGLVSIHLTDFMRNFVLILGKANQFWRLKLYLLCYSSKISFISSNQSS